MLKGLRQLRLLCFVLTLLFAQGCQKASPTRESSQVSGRAETPASESSAVAIPANNHADTVKRDGLVLIKGGTFQMGTDDGMPYEAPVHEVSVNSFWMDEHE